VNWLDVKSASGALRTILRAAQNGVAIAPMKVAGRDQNEYAPKVFELS
jgi:hypothetical protein